MKRAEFNGWLLETAELSERSRPYRAWVSDSQRFVAGYASGGTEADAVRAALLAAGNHYRKDLEALAGLEKEYFGAAGMLGPSPAQGQGRQR
ncbi:MAG: hypothetical protein JO112_10110 [Planctomycetes bacterium]|nr:hypothetical protein [Planctomycetota bacterium]